MKKNCRGTVTAIYPKLLAIRTEIAAKSGNTLYEGIDWDTYGFPREEIEGFLRWLDLGLRQAALADLRDCRDIQAFEVNVARGFVLARRMLQNIIYGGKSSWGSNSTVASITRFPPA